MSKVSSDPGSGVSTFDSAANESVRTASWGSSTYDRNKNDGVDEGASDDDLFDDEADLTK